MKSLYALFIFTVLIPGCGTIGGRYDGNTWIEPELRPLIADWAETCKMHIDPNKCDTRGIERIVFADKLGTEDTIGTCKITWEKMEEVRRVYFRRDVPLYTLSAKALLLHEMLHCRLGFERHTSRGIMAPYISSEKTLMDNWPELLEEAYDLVK